MRYFQKLRVDFIGKCLAENGHVNRRDIAEKFNVSVCQASLDLKLYMEQFGPLKYDYKKKRYEKETLK